MHDNICKFLVENFPEDLTSWLVDQAVELTEIKPQELSLEPIRADALILQKLRILFSMPNFKRIPIAKFPLGCWIIVSVVIAAILIMLLSKL
ncbi:MAG: hypothetical protein HC796_03055 [Synechococcaceae cyanobacterium RL_1_2]|nr:hypothetical protein [Synechococcaceae cyanobacterium RL_1_2]